MIFQDIRLIVFDFDGVFTDNKVYLSESGEEHVACNRSDGIGLHRLKTMGYETLILSTEKNPVVSKRAEKLKVRCIQSSDDKLKDLIDYCTMSEIDLCQVAFVGNDINDIEVMKEVKFAICVQDAFEEVKQISDYILQKKGGDGAVRELCDMIYFSTER